MHNTRLDFADNIRTLLICQVIMVHAAVTYGGEGGWYFAEPVAHMPTIIGLTLFNALSQSFFMSLLFLIAGFFTVISLQRNTFGRYLAGRLTRLGLPLLTYYWLIGPLTLWLALTIEGQVEQFNYFTAIHAGPMWFAQALLIFTGGYLLLKTFAQQKLDAFQPRNSKQGDAQVSRFAILLFILVLWLLTIFARVFWPMGEGIAGMQLGSFGQYISMFGLGVFAAHQNWQAWLNGIALKPLAFIACTGILLLPVGLALGFNDQTQFTPFMGGRSWQAIFYAAWESTMCVLLSLWVIKTVYQSRHFSHPVWRKLARANYGVYFLHPPVLLVVSGLLLPLPWPALVKFLLASLLTILATFGLAGLLVRLPIVRRIL